MSHLVIPDPFPALALPEGFRLRSLADEDLEPDRVCRARRHRSRLPADGEGRATVLEGVRRCGERGATAAYVGTAMPFYQALGFRQVYNCSAWRREWGCQVGDGEFRPAAGAVSPQ